MAYKRLVSEVKIPEIAILYYKNTFDLSMKNIHTSIQNPINEVL